MRALSTFSFSSWRNLWYSIATPCWNYLCSNNSVSAISVRGYYHHFHFYHIFFYFFYWYSLRSLNIVHGSQFFSTEWFCLFLWFFAHASKCKTIDLDFKAIGLNHFVWLSIEQLMVCAHHHMQISFGSHVIEIEKWHTIKRKSKVLTAQRQCKWRWQCAIHYCSRFVFCFFSSALTVGIVLVLSFPIS